MTTPTQKAVNTLLKNPFMAAYVAAIFFTESDELGEDEEFSIAAKDRYDLAPESVELIFNDCIKFLQQCGGILIHKDRTDGRNLAEQGGHDFWLTRNGHGAGFWDGDWPEHGEYLTQVAQSFPSLSVVVGDNGLIYLEG